jgi:hypothetical protein
VEESDVGECHGSRRNVGIRNLESDVRESAGLRIVDLMRIMPVQAREVIRVPVIVPASDPVRSPKRKEPQPLPRSGQER